MWTLQILLTVYLSTLASSNVDQPKCLSLPPGIQKLPTAVVFELVSNTYKLVEALNAFESVKPAMQFWDEITCLSQILTGGNNKTVVRQSQTFRLQQIIRDTIMTAGPPRYAYHPGVLPIFIQAVGLKGEGYSFLLAELREILLHYFPSLVFDIAMVMQNGTDSAFQKIVPQGVRQILSSKEKPVFLKNQVTGSYLNYVPGCESPGSEFNCTTFVLSKKRSDVGWNVVPEMLHGSTRFRSSQVTFQMMGGNKDKTALLGVPEDRSQNIRKMVVSHFLLSLKGNHSISISTFTDKWQTEPCFEEDESTGSLVISFSGLVELNARGWEETGSVKRERHCVNWTIIREG